MLDEEGQGTIQYMDTYHDGLLITQGDIGQFSGYDRLYETGNGTYTLGNAADLHGVGVEYDQVAAALKAAAYTGQIAAINFWSWALTAEEVAALYDGGPATCTSPSR